MSVTLTPSRKLPIEIEGLFMNAGSSEDISNMLQAILIAEIGGSTPSDNNDSLSINSMIYRINILTKFIRNLGSYLSLEPTDDDVLKIASLHKRIDYEQFSDYIFSGLGEWVYDDENKGLVNLEWSVKVANSFQRVGELLDICEEYSIKMNNHGESL